MLRIIKRYQNRKLYDVHQSCYVTLLELGEIIKSGDEIQVIDNRTRSDITAITKLMVVFELAKQTLSSAHNDILSKAIRSDEDFFTIIKEKI